MLKIQYLLVLIFILVNSCQKPDIGVEAIKAKFESYNAAILNDKGEEAVNYVDSRTLKYYGDILEKVKTADEATVNSLSFLDKFLVLMIRHRCTKEEIFSFDGKKLFIFAVNNGMVGKNSVSNNSIGEIRVEGDFAKGQLIVNGQKTPIYLSFYKEDNQWKLDLTSLFPMSTLVFKKLIKESEMTENEYIFGLLEAVSNKRAGKEIWVPTEKIKP